MFEQTEAQVRTGVEGMRLPVEAPGAVAVVRTALNRFLHREMKEGAAGMEGGRG